MYLSEKQISYTHDHTRSNMIIPSYLPTLHYTTWHETTLYYTALHSILYIQPFSEETYVFDIIHLFCHNVRSVCNLPIPFAVRPHSVYSPLISLQHAYALNSRSFSPELSNQPTRKYGNFRLMVKQSPTSFQDPGWNIMEVPFALVKVSWERPLSPEPNLQNFPSIPALDLFVPHESLSNFEDFLSHQLQPLSVAQQFLQNLPGLTLLEILEMQNEANSKAWSIKLWDLQAHRLFIKPFGCVAYLLLCHLCHWHLGTLEHVSCVSILALPASLSSIRIEKSFQSKKQDAGRWYLRCPRLSGCTQNHPSIYPASEVTHCSIGIHGKVVHGTSWHHTFRHIHVRYIRHFPSEIAAVPPRSNDHLAKRKNSAPFGCAAFFLKWHDDRNHSLYKLYSMS